jgi:hypothetical protein
VPAAAFGAAGAQHLQETGRHLGRGADGLWQLAKAERDADARNRKVSPNAPPPAPDRSALEQEERAIANGTRVEQLLNGFIAGKNQALHSADDAFYRRRGGDAIAAAPGIEQRLRALREAALEQATDDQRFVLAQRLDAQMRDAGEGIGRHIAAQSVEWQRDTANARQALIRTAFELEPDDDEKLLDLAEAYASGARELARIDGLPDATATVADAPIRGAAAFGQGFRSRLKPRGSRRPPRARRRS